jgi:MFS family permease
MVGLVFAMQGAGLIVGPLVASILLASGLSNDVTWRILLALGAIPGLAVFYLRRQIIVAGVVAAAGLLLTIAVLPEPKGKTLEQLSAEAYAPATLKLEIVS